MIHTYIEFKFEIYVDNKAIWDNGEFEQFSLRHQSFQLLNLFKFRPNFDKMIKIVFFFHNDLFGSVTLGKFLCK